MWICPVCRKPLRLIDGENRFCCALGHSFDRSRSGYVHLLPANRMHGRSPGDNKLMVEARRRFLGGGYYAPLAAQIAADVERYSPGGALLDIGCGEGYYLRRLTEQAAPAEKHRFFGVDISKTALDRAAKSCPEASFAVASAFCLPVADGSVGTAVNVFAPFCGEELRRVLPPGGLFVMALPGEEHLWELKQQVYDRPYKNEVKPFALDGFDLTDNAELRFTIRLPDRQTILNLFMMTPYYYKTGRQDQEKLQRLEQLEVTAHFFVPVYRRT